MTSVYSANSAVSFDELLRHLNSLPVPLLPPAKALDPALTDKISSLYLHPALEALLHLLNHDLPSAHFLVRHMQSDPAFEAMYLHGILHRIEGDFNNTRAWYYDVFSSEPFELVWGKATDEEKAEVEKKKSQGETKMPPQKSARDFVDSLEKLSKGQGDKEALAKESRREFDTVLDWCIEKFGTEKHTDASKAWVQPSQDISQKGQNMVTGNEGFRKF
ncbi:unnamed protein product [Aureobasidium vineae]|uniref:Uncharacterized protein n=1 Tax=Aureobasidium vineae TaxID=2773715 RepID=A0A9N8JYS6_9PEZI|nr:unnamed protein product [Aureobasidium vineae]